MLSLLSIILPFVALPLIWLNLRSRLNKVALAPPGPRANPIIGHVRFVPASRPEITYMKWGKQYSALPVIKTMEDVLIALLRRHGYPTSQLLGTAGNHSQQL